jgi:hypothetical protein
MLVRDAVLPAKSAEFAREAAASLWTSFPVSGLNLSDFGEAIGEGKNAFSFPT